MEIKKKEFCGYDIYELRGEVADLRDLEKVKTSINKAIQKGDSNVAIALHNCDYINSGLIGCFLGWKREMDTTGHKFCLIEPSKEAMEVLKVTGIPDAVDIYENEVEFMKKADPK